MPPHDSLQVLALPDSVEIGHAWTQRVVRDVGGRALLIKGPALAHHGLRNHHISSDVDVLVAPSDFDRVCGEIAARGWRERPASLIAGLTSVHSRTFLHDLWPCDIDVHRHFPGLLADPGDAFDALWAGRTQIRFGHQLCDVPDRVGSIVILALHSLRGTERQSRHAAELDQLQGIPLTPAERTRLADLASATGSTASLADVLPRLGVTVVLTADELHAPRVLRWRERVDSGSYGSYFWFAALRDATGAERIRIAWRALWPTRRDLLLTRPETRDTIAGRLQARVRRWGRGSRSLPRALRAIRGARLGARARTADTKTDDSENPWN